MDWTTISVVIGIVGGIISIIQGVAGIAALFQKNNAQAAVATPPPSGYPASGGATPARPMPSTGRAPAVPAPGAPVYPAPPAPQPQAPYSPPYAPAPMPQPAYPPPQQPGYAPATVLPGAVPRSTRRFGTHPWIALGSGVYLILYAVSAALGAFDQNSPNVNVAIAIFVVAANIFAFGVWIPSIVQAIRMRRWGWLVGIILGSAFVTFVYGIVGPTERRA